MAATDITQLSGRTFDEYTLTHLIGRGGMGAVYQAYQEELDRHVAVKILPRELANTPEYTERFRREARTAAALEHPHIVPVYDYGTADGWTYVVMRLLNGGTLGDKMQQGDDITLGQVANWLRDAARALDTAHGRGIIHRDIKPNNIMFDEQGTLYLVDFGIAKAVQTDSNLTAENIVLGTPAYMAPEMWTTRDITPAVDQYALGVIVYELIAGVAPFDGGTPHQLMYQHVHTPVPDVTLHRQTLPTALNSVMQRVLSKDPSQRYANAGDFAQAFSAAIDPVRDMAIGAVTATADVTVPHEKTPPHAEPTIKHAASDDDHAATTIKNTAKPDTPPAPQARIPAAAPQRRANAQDDTMGNRTIMMHIAGGGIAGVGLLVVVLIVIVVGVILLLRPQPAAAPQIARTATPSPEVTQGPPPTRDPALGTLSPMEGTQTAIANILSTLDARNTPDAPPFTMVFRTDLPTRLPLPGESPRTDITALPTLGNLINGRVLFREPQTPIRDVALSADGRLLASAHGDGAVRLWRNGIDAQPVILRGHSDVVNAVDFNATGRLLASVDNEGVTRIWDTQTLSEVHVMFGHSGAVRSVAFNPNVGPAGDLLATGGEDRTIRLWNVSTGESVRVLRGSTASVFALAFSPDGARLVSGSETVRQWDVETGLTLPSFNGHSAGQTVRGVAYSADGTRIASGSTDNTVIIWDADTRRSLHQLNDAATDVWTVVFSPDGRTLAAGDRGNDIQIWQVSNGNRLAEIEDHAGWVLGLAYTPDGATLISGSGDGTVRAWDVE